MKQVQCKQQFATKLPLGSHTSRRSWNVFHFLRGPCTAPNCHVTDSSFPCNIALPANSSPHQDCTAHQQRLAPFLHFTPTSFDSEIIRPNPRGMRCAMRPKQMGPIDVNGGVHTARKQHQRKNVPICARVASRVPRPVWIGPKAGAKNH